MLLHPWIAQAISFWRLNLLAWLVFGLMMFCARWIFQQDLARALGFTIFSESAAFGVSLLLRPLYHRLGFAFQLRTAVQIAVFSLLAAVVLAVLCHLFANLTGWHNPHFTPLENAILRILLMWTVFMGWSFGYFWLRSEVALRSETRLAREAAREAQRMELRMLRAQLDPHFLFNSLNGIAAEIHPHPDAATEMVRELSDYLRYSLDHRKRTTSPLSDELQAMKAYLDIEKARFRDRLSVRIDASEEARWRNVPCFLLQPLVENAIKHGLTNSLAPLDLSITAKTSGDKLLVEVSNTGHLADGETGREGLGLDTLRRRLELHYPHRHVFQLKNAGSHVLACLELQGGPCSV